MRRVFAFDRRRRRNRRTSLLQLSKNGVHDSGRQQNLPVRNWARRLVGDRQVKFFEQVFNAGLHVKITREKSADILAYIGHILPGKNHGWDKFLGVTLETRPAKLDQSLVVLVKNEAVFRPINPKLMDGGAHLRGEGEVSRCLFLVRYDDPEFIDNLSF